MALAPPALSGAGMMARLRRLVPSREQVSANRWLRWLGPGLLDQRLWRPSRRGVAVGAAAGVFFGLLFPLAQIPFAAAAAVLLRANVPAAIGSTLVSNPVTFAPLYLIAHRLGTSLLDQPESKMPDVAAEIAAIPETESTTGWWTRVWQFLQTRGKPLFLGLSILAVTGAAATYVLTLAIWRLAVAWNRRQRRNRSGKAS